MKRRPSSSFLVCIAVALVFGGIGFWFLSKLKAFPMHQWRSLTFTEILHGESRDSPKQQAAARKRSAELTQEMLTEFPDLVIIEKPVPDERNGFRLLYELAEEMDGKGIRATPALQDGLESSTPWDSAAMRAALAENSELIARIEAIATLPDRSSANMPKNYVGYFSLRWVKMSSDILLAKARLAAEAKDETEALRLVTATLNLASHLDQVEGPTFLSGAVAILTDRQVAEAILEKLLPALGRDADPSRWRAALATRPAHSPDAFVRMLRGEWNNTMNLFMVASILESDLKTSPVKTDARIRAMASQYDFWVRNLRAARPAVLLSLPKPPTPSSKLSPEIRQILDSTREGCESWGKGSARTVSARAITLAALDLLILERSGDTLTADSVSKVLPEPLSGEAFLYDPSTRTLSMPSAIADSVGGEPVVLPW